VDYLKEHQVILKLAAAGELPDTVSKNDPTSIEVLRELIEEGLIHAIDASSSSGRAYLEPRITISGREYLNELERRTREASPTGKVRRYGLRLLDWGGGIIAGIAIAWVSKFFF